MVRPGPRLQARGRLLLTGAPVGTGLIPALRALAADQKIAFEASLPLVPQGVPSPPTEVWASRPELPRVLGSFRPTVLAIVLDPPAADPAARARQVRAHQQLLTLGQQASAAVAWIGSPFTTALDRSCFPTNALQLSRGPDGVSLTVAGYAGWAGAFWQWLS